MRAEYYRQKFQWPRNRAVLGFMFCWGLGFGSGMLMAPGGLGLLFGAVGWSIAAGAAWHFWKQIRHQRRGVRIDQQGLVELYWFDDPKRYPWATLEDVQLFKNGARIRTQRGDIALGGDLAGWVTIAQRAETAIVGEPPGPPSGALVPPEEVAAWLGISPDGELVIRAPRASWSGILLIPVWLVVTGLLCAFYYPFIRLGLGQSGREGVGVILFVLAHGAIFFSVFSGGLLLTILRKLKGALGGGMIADVTGISVGGPAGRRHYSWDEIHGVDMVNGEWRVTTAEDPFLLPPGRSQTSRLIEAIRQATAARRDGRALPHTGPIPAAAISLARETGESAEASRGISLGSGAPD